MKKILFIFGTRPEAIKLAPIILEFQKRGGFEVEICITAQHRSMLDETLKCFGIQADYDLNIMQEAQDLFSITANVLNGLKNVLERAKADFVFVHGDTTTTFAAALGAFYCKIPLCHIEAGLRTWDKYNPFPEEANRMLTTKLATYHFAPTKLSYENLIKDGVDKRAIRIVGNSVIDALIITLAKIKKDIAWRKKILEDINLSFLQQDSTPFILVTAHRRESFGVDITNIALAIKQIAQNLQSVQIIYPLHLNPNIQQPMRKILGDIPNIHLIKPLPYESFVYVMSKCKVILTDSGGIQEEATFFHKPTLILRNKTERKEALKCRTLKLVGTDKDKIVAETMKLFLNKRHYDFMSNPKNSLPYGNGKSSKKIYNFLKSIAK